MSSASESSTEFFSAGLIHPAAHAPTTSWMSEAQELEEYIDAEESGMSSEHTGDGLVSVDSESEPPARRDVFWYGSLGHDHQDSESGEEIIRLAGMNLPAIPDADTQGAPDMIQAYDRERFEGRFIDPFFEEDTAHTSIFEETDWDRTSTSTPTPTWSRTLHLPKAFGWMRPRSSKPTAEVGPCQKGKPSSSFACRVWAHRKRYGKTAWA
mmetsp:Transcript_16854/g.38060  ORF Transcript_16854/g.38060 Transcript_16854/m.38060 type:complete len:210 (-) Transcript_16854:20-649(-)